MYVVREWIALLSGYIGVLLLLENTYVVKN